ncbi:MAG: glycosyltransferase [Methylacidiphilales bacterium]|nr:glycosyltransferase [Candidatus Methylacidiphilales bacterium]
MAVPRYTVIIPTRRFRLEEPVLAALRLAPPPSGPAQIIVAEGGHPARQRNAALACARGEIIVFLDNDCSVDAAFWQELEAAFTQPEVEIVGGPARLRPNATFWEEIFHVLLTHPLLVGTVSARYSPHGPFRPATQTDLILCNLAVRKSIFAKIGPLSTDLYPNEENEWLDRAHRAGVRSWYDPQLQVFRPQRATPGQMALMLLRYGMGRTRQFMVSGWRPTFHQFLPLMLIGTFVALFYWRLETEFVLLWLLASVIITLSCGSHLNLGQKIIAGLLAPLIPLTYAIGQIIGWIALLFPAPPVSNEIVLRDENEVVITSSSI